MKKRTLIEARTGHTGEPRAVALAVLATLGIPPSVAEAWMKDRTPPDPEAEIGPTAARMQARPDSGEDGPYDIWINGPILTPGDAAFFRAIFEEECVSPADVQAALAKAGKGRALRLRIASPGGYVSQMASINSYLAEHAAGGARIDTVADGMAASAAGSLFLVGSDRLMSEYAQLMFHRAWAGRIIVGNASDFESECRSTMDGLKSYDQTLIEALAKRSNLTAEQIAAEIERKDWVMNRKQAKEAGIATGDAFAEGGEEKPEAKAQDHRAHVSGASAMDAGLVAYRRLTGLALSA